MANNRSQIYIDTVDNTSLTIERISRSISQLQNNLAQTGNASQSAFNQMNGHLGQQTGLLSNINNMFGNLGSTILGTATKFLSVVGAVLVLKKAVTELFDFMREGVKLNIQTEGDTIGIGGIISSVYKIKQNGKELDGTQKFNKALLLSEDIMKRLRISAIMTGASFDEVKDGFTQAIGPGGNMNIDPKEIEKISTLIANVGKAINLPKGQIGQETRALFNGKIDRSASIGNLLQFQAGGKNEKEYEAALKKGGETFTKFLVKSMKEYQEAAEAYAKSLGGILDQVGESYRLFKGDSAKGLSDELTKLKPLADSVFNTKTGDFTERLDGVKLTLQTIGSIIGTSIVDNVKIFLEFIYSVSDGLDDNQGALNGILSVIGNVGDLFGSIIDIVSDLFSGVTGLVSAGLILLGVSEDNGKELSTWQGILKAINIGFVVIHTVLGLIKDVVKNVADAIRLLIGGAIGVVVEKFGEFVGALGRTAGRLGLNNVAKDFEQYSSNIAKNSKKAADAVIGDQNRMVKFANSTGNDPSVLWENAINDQNKAIERLVKGTDTKNSIYEKYKNTLQNMRKNQGKVTPGLEGVTVEGTNKPPKEPKAKKEAGTDITDELLKGYEKELEAFKKGNDFKRKENQLYYNNFKKTIDQFYDDKEALDKADFDKMIANYNEEIKIVQERLKEAGNTDKQDEKYQVKLAELISKKVNAEKEYKLAILDASFARERDFRNMNNQLMEFKANIAELLGNSDKSNTIKLKVEIDNLKFNNQNNPKMLAEIDTYAKIKGFKNSQAQDSKMLELSEENLNIRREAGYVKQIDYFNEMGKLNSTRLAQYEKEQAFIKSLAPGEQDNIRLKELENNILKVRSQLDPLAADIKKTFESSFGTFFNDVISGTKSIKDAFKDLTTSISNYLSKLVSEKLAAQLFDLGGSKGGGSGGGGGFLDSAVSWVSGLFSGGGRATGGFMDAGVGYITGEGGKELFIPETRGYMMNASRTNDFLNGGSGGQTIQNINVQLQTPNYSSFNNSEGQVGSMMANAIRKAQRNL